MNLDPLKAVQAQKEQQAKETTQDSKNQIANLGLQETIVKTAKMVVDYMDGKTTKTAVINQIEGFATSEDSKEVTEALSSLHETLKTHENVDITPLTEVMNNVLKEVKDIPKDHADKVELPESKDYTKALSDLTSAIGKVESAVQAQETNVEAPVVNVDAPVVKVDAPDLKPLTKDLKAIVAAVNKVPKEEQKVIHTNVLIDEKFDQWKLVMDTFDEDNPTPEGICYYYKNKKVAELKYTVKDGMIVGAKKVAVK